ncbi:MAG TPA: hypothetical protein VEK79_23130 [Thermoanaerobaculia bacterium]|nr:hypothetical protein [Thermoanaerobaculia bacterium]
MSLDAAARIARAVLYEGYLLYPYRASSAKNQQRWTFGVLVPRGFDATGERSGAKTEVVYTGGVAEARLRFLQIEGDAVFEREVVAAAGRHAFRFGDIEGAIVARAEQHRLSVEIENLTAANESSTREEALPLSMLSVHVVLTLRDGSFVSTIDPPEAWREAAASCRNEGLYPVLLAETCMLAAPIILYDYPRVAPESAGDLFDATEIDEILTLRILTLTEEEKDEIRRGDARGRELLERTEALTHEQRMLLHGAIREIR